MTTRRTQRFTDTDFASDPLSYTRAHPLAIIESQFNFDSAFAELLDKLKEELNASQLYRTVWSKAEIEYEKKKQNNPSYFKTTTPKECYVAIIAYTLEVYGLPVQLYSHFNSLLREMKDSKSDFITFPYKSFYFLLVMAEKKGIDNYPAINNYLYRGVSNYYLSPEPKVNDPFYFHYFASCTTDKTLAAGFLKSKGTLIEIRNGAKIACGVAHYSPFDENEVLVFPRNMFRVVQFEKYGAIHRVVLENIGNL